MAQVPNRKFSSTFIRMMVYSVCGVHVREKGLSPVRKNTLFRVRAVVTVSFRKRNQDKGDNGDEEFY